MSWDPTSASPRSQPKPTWEELAKLEEASPGLTRLPPGRMVATHGMRPAKKPLAKDMLIQALSEAGVGRKKRGIILRKLEHSKGYVTVKMSTMHIEASHVTGQAKPAKSKERAFAGDMD